MLFRGIREKYIYIEIIFHRFFPSVARRDTFAETKVQYILVSDTFTLNILSLCFTYLTLQFT